MSDGSELLERRQADEAALAVGFTIATGVEVAVSRDGAGTPVIDVPLGQWVECAAHARDHLQMDFLDWLSAVDQPDGDPAGVDVVLHVAATSSAGVAGEQARFAARSVTPPSVRRLMLRTRVPEAALKIPSLTGLWPGVAWHERETLEMFGVEFSGFEDGSGLEMRPLLLPDGFEGTPLRKSFVLAARAAKAWPGAKDPADTGGKSPSRRKILPPGVPEPSWGPREPGAEPVVDAPARPVRRAPRKVAAAPPAVPPTPLTPAPEASTPAPEVAAPPSSSEAGDDA